VRAVVYAQLRRAPSTRAVPDQRSVRTGNGDSLLSAQGPVATGVVVEHDEMTDEVEEPTFVEHAASRTSNCGIVAGASVSPSMVRQGMKRSLSALIAPIRASRPSEITSTAL
jgi:hypothetical protein